MKILFLSTLNLATNPRLFKEIKLALEIGHSVDVICFEFNNWSHSFNLDLLKEIEQANITLIPANRKPFAKWFYSVAKETGYRALGKMFSFKGRYLSQAISRRSDLLLQAIQQLKGPFDLVVGHNPGALYPTIYAGKKFNCATGFDVEDYHPGEGENPHEQQLIKKLIEIYLPQTDYVSFAAPLIKSKTAQDIGQEGGNWQVVLNHFKATDFIKPATIDNQSLQLVWFSQNVNYKRGLEQIIPIVEQYHPAIHLTLIGNRKEAFYNEYIKGKKAVSLLPPKDQLSLHRAMSGYDIGLAIEPGKDKNNFIALANKLLTYFQSGLYILASDTPAHLDFFESKRDHGIAVSLEPANIPFVFDGLLQKKDLLRKAALARYAEAAKHSWETESLKLKKIWEHYSA